MDPFIESISADLVKQVEENLEPSSISVRARTPVSQETVVELLRTELNEVFHDYSSMGPEDIAAAAGRYPSLLKVAAEDLDLIPLAFADNKQERQSFDAWLDKRRPVVRSHGQRSQTFVPSVGESWAAIGSDPAKAPVVAEAMGIAPGNLQDGAIYPSSLIRNVIAGRLRAVAEVAFSHDFGPRLAEVNAGIDSRTTAAQREQEAAALLTPDWREFLEDSGQPVLSVLGDAAQPAVAAVAAVAEPGHEL
jgi:hypothetical protein